jgi:uncharacterized protein (DUF2147 family)
MSRWIPFRLLSLFLALCGSAHADSAPVLTGPWVIADGEALMAIDAAGGEARVVLRAVAPPLTNDDPTPRSSDRNNPDPDLRDRPLAGLEIGRLRHTDDGGWRGRLYDPETGKTFRVVARLIDADVLEVRGYLGIPALGRTMHWVRLAHHRQRLMALWAEASP